MIKSYQTHLSGPADLITSREAARAGFIAFALEKNRLATPYISDARLLKAAVSQVQSPSDLLAVPGIQAALLTAAGISDKALAYFTEADKQIAVVGLIENFLEPAGDQFVDELVYRYLLVRGDTLGGSMRNIVGALAQQKVTRAIISALRIAGVPYQWRDLRRKQWFAQPDLDADVERNLRGLYWTTRGQQRTLLYNLKVPIVGKNVDLCLLDGMPSEVDAHDPSIYLALGELKGGIDPAGSDEHWKTARTALLRIHDRFEERGYHPALFFIGAAIESSMAAELWAALEAGRLNNAANLNHADQVSMIARWLCSL